MKLRKDGKAIVLLILAVLILSSSAFAHSGRTDSNGGHRDNKNASGLGPYHYHHGYGPHLHPGGVCPYDNVDKTDHTNGTKDYSGNKTTSENTEASDKNEKTDTPETKNDPISNLKELVFTASGLSLSIGTLYFLHKITKKK